MAGRRPPAVRGRYRAHREHTGRVLLVRVWRVGEQTGAKGRGGRKETKVKKMLAHFVSFASQTVEKWPCLSFLKTRYLPSEKAWPMCTGWYPLLTQSSQSSSSLVMTG